MILVYPFTVRSSASCSPLAIACGAVGFAYSHALALPSAKNPDHARFYCVFASTRNRWLGKVSVHAIGFALGCALGHAVPAIGRYASRQDNVARPIIVLPGLLNLDALACRRNVPARRPAGLRRVGRTAKRSGLHESGISHVTWSASGSAPWMSRCCLCHQRRMFS